jgi:O-antigen/teichoic acid export membrane protein
MTNSRKLSKSNEIQSSGEVAERVTRNTFLLLLSSGVEAAFGVISVAVFARYLGLELFGEYAFIMSLVVVFSTLSHFGLRRIVIREVVKDKENAGQYLGSAIIIRFILSVIAFGFLFVTIRIIGLKGIYATASYILMISETMWIFYMLFMTIFFAFEKMAYRSVLTILNRIVSLILIVIVVTLDYGFILLMCSLLIPNVLILLLSYVLVTRRIGKPRFTFDPSQLKHLIKESSPLFAELLFRQSFMRVGVFLLKATRDVAEVSLFHAPYSLIIRLQMIPMAFTTSLLPPMVRLVDESKGTFQATYVKAFKILFCMCLPIAVATTILADKIILLIFGRDFMEAVIVLKILIWMVIFLFMEFLFNAVFVSLRKQWLTAVSNAVMFTINLVLGLLLIPAYGYMGACAGTMSAYICRFLLSYYFISKNDVVIPFWQVLPKPLISAVFMGGVMFFLKEFNSVVALAAGLMTYSTAILLTGSFSRDEIGVLKKSVYSGNRTKRAVPLKQ